MSLTVNSVGTDRFSVQLSYIQCFIVVVTVVLIVIFTLVIARTRLGRAQRACEQDRTMAALLGVNVDRTISLTFVIGAALAAVAGMMVTMYYGVIDFFIGFLAGLKAFTAAVNAFSPARNKYPGGPGGPGTPRSGTLRDGSKLYLGPKLQNCFVSQRVSRACFT